MSDAPSASGILDLNVGGRRFTLSQQNIIRCCGKDSFLATLIDSELPKDRDSKGVVFIDRDPDAFACLAGYLRHERWPSEKHPPAEIVLQEADYYGVVLLPSDYTISYIRSARKLKEKYFPYVKEIRKIVERLLAAIAECIEEDRKITFVIVPEIESLRERLANVALWTSSETLEGINLAKLRMSLESQEGVPYLTDSSLHASIESTPLEGIEHHLRAFHGLTFSLTTGAVHFPYMSTHSDPVGTPPLDSPMVHSPISSRIHGSLITYIGGSGVDLRQRDLLGHHHHEVCSAWYVTWEGEVR
eukprot:TRINITY_DN37531_c0_g1_i1.p1 TRINITY_DN37531_c0_g1~~TRINITY_DN37531_c0_g1_i1.p1  ORF type:complete len:312 (+),score=26.97 TRINITY_DN37531_c0_g1_i1:33-938(+)